MLHRNKSLLRAQFLTKFSMNNVCISIAKCVKFGSLFMGSCITVIISNVKNTNGVTLTSLCPQKERSIGITDLLYKWSLHFQISGIVNQCIGTFLWKNICYIIG